MKQRGILLLVLAAALALTACGVDVNVQLDRDGATITVRLDEARINDLISQEAVTVRSDDGLLGEVQRIEMLPERNAIRVFGTAEGPQGNRAEGSFDAQFTTQDGNLLVQIVDVQIAGLTGTDERVDRVNRRLADAFAEAASQNENVTFVSADVTTDGLTMVIRAGN